MIHFHVVIRGCDCEKDIGKTCHSVLMQTHRVWDGILHLDGPNEHAHSAFAIWYRTDRAYGISLRNHPERLGVAGNLWRALEFYFTQIPVWLKHQGPDHIVAILDGDGDTLPKDALARVAHVYEKYPDTLVTYGSYKKRSKGDRTKISQPYPKGADVRKYPWRASHLKTFRASLLPYVKPEWFQDEKGNWLQAASDVALMLPLMELAGLDRCRHIHEITYVWNDSPVSKAKRALQKRCEAIVRAKPREGRLP